MLSSISACVYEAFVVFFCGCSSIWTLTALSIFRYLQVCRFQGRWIFDGHFCVTFIGALRGEAFSIFPPGNILKRKHVFASFIPLNLISSSWCISPFLGWGKYGPETNGITCSLDWSTLSPSYVFTIFTFSYCLPAAIIVASYALIISFARSSRMHSQRHFRGRETRGRDLFLTKASRKSCKWSHALQGRHYKGHQLHTSLPQLN